MAGQEAKRRHKWKVGEREVLIVKTTVQQNPHQLPEMCLYHVPLQKLHPYLHEGLPMLHNTRPYKTHFRFRLHYDDYRKEITQLTKGDVRKWSVAEDDDEKTKDYCGSESGDDKDYTGLNKFIFNYCGSESGDNKDSCGSELDDDDKDYRESEECVVSVANDLDAWFEDLSRFRKLPKVPTKTIASISLCVM